MDLINTAGILPVVSFLDLPLQWQEYYTKYPNGFTIFEAISTWVAGVNDMITHLNLTDEQIRILFTHTLPENIENVLTTWYNNGQLATIINGTIFGAINDRLDDLEAIKDKQTYRFTLLEGKGNGTYGWNGQSFIQDNITTHNGFQYFVYVNDAKYPVVCKRKLPDGEIESVVLSALAGNPLVVPTADDLHNVYSIAVDSVGYIHLAGNLHGNPLRYIKSASPEDITAWVAGTMTGTEEDIMSYPCFVKLPAGELLFFYRQGGSGNGDTYCNRYNAGTGLWERRAKVIDGTISNESAYLNHVGVDWTTGAVHLMFVWRGTGNASTNNDICYAMSLDQGATWKKADGTTYTLPITHANAEKVVDTAPTLSGLVNQCGFEVDSLGNPHGAFWLYDTNGYTQLHHVWHDGTVWHNDKVTNWKHRVETDLLYLKGEVSRPSVFTYKERVFIIYRHNILRNGELRVIEVSEGKDRKDFPILGFETFDYEPTFDTHALKTRNELHIMVSPLKTTGENSTDYHTPGLWAKQIVGVVSIDLTKIDMVIAGVSLPRWEAVYTAVKRDTTTETITSATYIPVNGTSLLLPKDKGVYAFKASVRGKSSTGTLLSVFGLRQVDTSGGASVTLSDTDMFNLTSSSTFDFHSPHIPLWDAQGVTVSSLCYAVVKRVTSDMQLMVWQAMLSKLVY